MISVRLKEEEDLCAFESTLTGTLMGLLHEPFLLPSGHRGHRGVRIGDELQVTKGFFVDNVETFDGTPLYII